MPNKIYAMGDGMKRTKGQVSVEFFLLFVIIISILAILLFFSGEIQNIVLYITKYQQASSVAFKIASAANSAIETEGLIVKQSIPLGFNISIQPAAILVSEINTNISASWPIPHVNVSSSISQNSTLLNITFINQTLYITG
jgi:uncharacterized protein (UPF0333 family)